MVTCSFLGCCRERRCSWGGSNLNLFIRYYIIQGDCRIFPAVSYLLHDEWGKWGLVSILFVYHNLE